MIINIYKYREYILKNAWINFKNRYAAASLGFFWHAVQPLLMITVYSIVFSMIFTPVWSGELGEKKYFFVLYLCAGYLPWMALVDCVTSSSSSFQVNATFLKKLPIPEQVFIAQEAMMATYSLVLSFLILLAAAVILGHYPTRYWLLLPLPLILFQGFGFSLGLFFGTMNVFFKDVLQAVNALFQMWFWLTPIIYPLDIVPELLQKIMFLNPAFPFIDSVRDLFLFNRMPGAWNWVAMLGWTFSFAVFSYLVLRKLRPEIRDNI